MSRMAQRFAALFTRQRNGDSSQDDQSLLIASAEDNRSMQIFEDSSMQSYFKPYMPYMSPFFFTLKVISYIIIFVLAAFLFYQCEEYFKEAKLQQTHIRMELNQFHLTAEQKLKQLNVLQESMKDKLENINVLTEQGSRKIKDLFTFSKSDLLRDYVEDTGEQCEFIPLSLRFDCHPENGASQLSCTQRGCCWNPLHQLNYEKQVPLDVPYCYYPKNWSLYKYKNFSKDDNDFSGLLALQRNSFYKNDLPLIKIEATGIDDSTLRVKV